MNNSIKKVVAEAKKANCVVVTTSTSAAIIVDDMLTVMSPEGDYTEKLPNEKYKKFGKIEELTCKFFEKESVQDVLAKLLFSLRGDQIHTRIEY